MNKRERDVMGFLLEHSNPEFKKLGQDIYGMSQGTGPPGKKKGRRWWQGMMLLGEELMKGGTIDQPTAEQLAEALEIQARKNEVARCFATHKVIFRSEAHAKARRGSGTKADRIRAYHCKECLGWHYTSNIG